MPMARRSIRCLTVAFLVTAVAATGRAALRPGQVILADSANGRLLVVNPTSGSFSTLAPRPGETNFLEQPTGVVISRGTRSVYALDGQDGELVAIDPTTGHQTLAADPTLVPLDFEDPRALEIPPLAPGAEGDRLLVTAAGRVYEVERGPAGYGSSILSEDPALLDQPVGSTLERFADGESFWIAGGAEGMLHVARPPGGSFSFEPLAGFGTEDVVADVDRAPSGLASVVAVYELPEPPACANPGLLDLSLMPLSDGNLLRCPLAAAVGPRGEIYVADAATTAGGAVRIVKVQDGLESIVAEVPDGALPTLPADLELVPGQSALEIFRGGPEDTIEVQGVSSDGSAIVGSRFDGVAEFALRIDGNGNLLDLVEGLATAASRDGSVVVGRDVDGLAFRWTETTGPLPLELPDGYTLSSARAISDDGQVVAGSAREGSASVAVRWDLGQGGAPEPLDYLDPGDTAASIAAGSADGSVLVGLSGTDLGAPGASRAVRWGPDGSAEDLGTIPGGPIGAFVTDVSGDGRAVVGYGTGAKHLAFRWTKAQGMVALDAINSAFQSEASAVSGDGRMVFGYLYNGPTPSFTFVWHPLQGLRDFWVELVDVHGLDFADRTLGIDDVSADGRTFVGTIYDEEQNRSAAFRVRLVPEPDARSRGAAALLLLATLTWLRGRDPA
jgi:uncharacterized membrane protein